jgi:hypothetical protein
LDFVSGVGVKVRGGAVIELVADAEFASEVNAEGGDADGYGSPADVTEDGAAFFAGSVVL